MDKIFLASVHQTYLKPYRNYLHFLALGEWMLDKKFNLYISEKPFFFFEPFDSEFCCGICQIKEHIIFSFGFRNSEAWLMKIKSKTLFDILDVCIKSH